MHMSFAHILFMIYGYVIIIAVLHYVFSLGLANSSEFKSQVTVLSSYNFNNFLPSSHLSDVCQLVFF